MNEIRMVQITDKDKQTAQDMLNLLHKKYAEQPDRAYAVVSFLLQTMESELGFSSGLMTVIQKSASVENDA